MNSAQDDRLRRLLEAEWDLMEHDGESKSAPPWAPRLIFQETHTCIRYDDQINSCAGCPLMRFVPIRDRNRQSPCRYIPLTSDGRTLNDLYKNCSEEELRSVVRGWLQKQLQAFHHSPCRAAG